MSELSSPKIRSSAARDYLWLWLGQSVGLLGSQAGARGEHLRSEQFCQKAKVNTFMKRLPFDDSEFKFHEWTMHDYRRFSITEKGLLWGNLWDVAQVHGQVTEAIARRFFQWGLMKRRKGEADDAFDLEIIS